MQGFNVTVFAYGQTSSGKTFTMRGTDKSLGLIPLSIQQVFQFIENDKERDYEISVSYLEVSIPVFNRSIDLQRDTERFDRLKQQEPRNQGEHRQGYLYQQTEGV
jgi:hypothetical protein